MRYIPKFQTPFKPITGELLPNKGKPWGTAVKSPPKKIIKKVVKKTQPPIAENPVSNILNDFGTRTLNAVGTFGGSIIGDVVKDIGGEQAAKAVEKYSFGMIPYTKPAQFAANRQYGNWNNRINSAANAASMVIGGKVIGGGLGYGVKKATPYVQKTAEKVAPYIQKAASKVGNIMSKTYKLNPAQKLIPRVPSNNLNSNVSTTNDLSNNMIKGVLHGDIPMENLDLEIMANYENAIQLPKEFVNKWGYNMPAIESSLVPLEKRLDKLEKFKSIIRERRDKLYSLEKRKEILEDPEEFSKVLGDNNEFYNSTIRDYTLEDITNKISNFAENMKKEGGPTFNTISEGWNKLQRVMKLQGDIQGKMNNTDILEPTFKKKINSILEASNIPTSELEPVKFLNQLERNKIVFIHPDSPSYKALGGKSRLYIEENLNDIDGFNNIDYGSITFASKPVSEYIAVEESVPNTSRSFIDKLLGKNKMSTLYSDKQVIRNDYMPSSEIEEVIAHEGGHDLQKTGGWINHFVRNAPEYNYRTTRTDNPIAKRFADALMEPEVAPEPGQSSYNTWLSSMGELHSDLMSTRYKRASQLMNNKNWTLDQAIAELKQNEGKYLNEFSTLPEVKKFFRPGISTGTIQDLLKYLPAAAGVGYSVKQK